MSSHIVTPGPYRATKLWNEVTKLFRAGMPLKKHRQHFRVYTNCFTASTAVDWLHELLKNNSNFGPDVTRQQTVQLLKKFLKNHVIEDVKGRWGMEDLEDNSQLYRFPSTSPLKPIPNRPTVMRRKSLSMMDRESFFKFRGSKKFDKETLENVDPETQESPVGSSSGETERSRELTEDDIHVIWKNVTLTHLQKLVGSASLEGVLDPAKVNPQFIVYNMTKVNKHGVVSLEDKTEDLPHWVLSAMKCLANWPKYDSDQPTYLGFERDVFKTVSDYFYSLPQPLLTYQYYELFVNILGLLQPSLEQVAVEALQLCTLLLPPVSRRKLQLLLRMISRMSQNVDMPRLHDVIGTRTLLVQTFSRCVLSCEEVDDLDELLATRLLSFLMDHHQEVLQVPVYLRNAVEDHINYLKSLSSCPGSAGPIPSYSFCRQISCQEFEQQKLSVSQSALADLLENIIKDKSMSVKEKKKKIKLFQKEYPDIYSRRFPTTESETQLFADKPKIKPPMLLSIKKAKTFSIRN
ncbi:DEP domain-containing protein 1A isoform X1 [Danio rerio]|uniref:DEP domain-containing protein 1A n=1 Tax=Danio rerio TaxID=7955 RepID=A0A2R8QHF9_DANRE|nr:DEP domain-containing protein 1A isoform X1 [Danio rerio]|eukprot:XP_005166830.1 DEP domain-containing protein 1A isoform X1 [Danio rerio]